MPAIKRIRTLRDAGILANKSAKDPGIDFLHYNLIYGFNGSGKSTLSRIFASLQKGHQDKKLPEDCYFEIEADNGTIYRTPDSLNGMENCVCVFNTDFVSQNLLWDEGKANSIFYISQEQADSVAELRSIEADLSASKKAEAAEKKILIEREKTLRAYRTERAKVIAAALHAGNRRYEAGQLRTDYEKLKYDSDSILTPDALHACEEIARLSAPPQPLTETTIDINKIGRLIESARRCAELNVGTALLDEIEKHPTMVTWLKTGHDYHTEHDLKTCLLCGNHFAQERKDALTAMLNGKIGETLSLLNRINNEASEIDEAVSLTTSTWPRPVDFDLELQTEYEQALKTLNKSLKEIHALIIEARRIVRVRLAELTSTVSHSLPEKDSVAAKCETLQAAITAINSLIREHNTQIADFADRQEQARLSIRQHYLAEGHEDYVSVQDAVSEAAESIGRIQDNIQSLEEKARALRARVRTHSPAAQKITKLVHAYLGHGELTIIAAEEGYELHRHGEIVRGSPSEGEKTAIALCYFLSTLESEGRAIKDLIVVVDDPISSLDTKAMNYACALILSCLSNASQVFVLTHNQHCMNEFRKAWRHLAEPRNRETDPTAKLLYMDVRLPEGTEQRTAHIIEMPPLLRTYDSEYHFLCHKVLEFEAMGEGHSPYGFMMPNVIRRVLEVFLAFKVPGSAPIKDKLAKLCKEHGDLDPVRILALERLTQVESHSDSLDDLITHSSMTVEEARDANAALLELMAAADSNHTAAIRRQCRFET